MEKHVRYAYLLQKTGKIGEAQDHVARAIEGLNAMIDAGADIPSIRVALAGAAIVQNDKDAAYHWLQEAIDGGFVVYRYAESDPLFESIREEPKFKEMMAELRARVKEMRERVKSMDQ
jgi:hypothetical protein